MMELLFFTGKEILVRNIDKRDEFRLFPKHPYTQRRATINDIKRLAPGLLEEADEKISVRKR